MPSLRLQPSPLRRPESSNFSPPCLHSCNLRTYIFRNQIGGSSLSSTNPTILGCRSGSPALSRAPQGHQGWCCMRAHLGYRLQHPRSTHLCSAYTYPKPSSRPCDDRTDFQELHRCLPHTHWNRPSHCSLPSRPICRNHPGAQRLVLVLCYAVDGSFPSPAIYHYLGNPC